MRIDVITLFPAMFEAVTQSGITARALERGLWSLICRNPRDFTTDAWHTVDDRPYGGGPGMVMMAEPLAAAIAAARSVDAGAAAGTGGAAGVTGAAGAADTPGAAGSAAAPDATGDGNAAPGRLPGHAAGAASGANRRPVIALSPQGRPLDDARVRELAALPGLILVAGRYEAIDQRLLDRHVDEEIAIGEFVVSGGELPAMMLIDALVRLLPGAMNDPRSAQTESFAEGLLDHPQYTRPEVFEGRAVPPVLLSGHHARIARWRREQALLATLRKRPDLIARARKQGRFDAADERVLAGVDAGTAAGPEPGKRPVD